MLGTLSCNCRVIVIIIIFNHQVLQQERLERARQTAAASTAAASATTTSSSDAVDNAHFLHNLPPDLRRQILSDMDDSHLSHLPENMITEARTLRQERDSRRRQMLEQRHAFLERMMEEAHLRSTQSGAVGGGGDGPPSSWPQLGGVRYAVVNLNPHMLDSHVLGGSNPYYLARGFLGGGAGGSGAGGQKAGDQSSKQMLDQEALTCLLVLLFLDQTKLHNNRLHRIVKNLSQHVPTRAWILSSLLAIVKEMGRLPTPTPRHLPISATCPMPPPLTPHPDVGGTGSGPSGTGNVNEATPPDSTPPPSVTTTTTTSVTGGVVSTPVMVTPHHYPCPHWLDISINAALGSHAKVFQFEGDHTAAGGGGGKATSSSASANRISIHPLAGTTISHNILDLLVFLGRHFGSSFLPSQLLPRDKSASAAAAEEKKEEAADVLSNFWQILLKLDGAVGRKGKGALKGFKYQEFKGLLTEQELFSNSIMGQLMDLFTHEIIRDNTSLIDKLLKLLSIVSGSIPKNGMKKIAAIGGGASSAAVAGAEGPKSPSQREDGVVGAVATSSLPVTIISEPSAMECSEGVSGGNGSGEKKQCSIDFSIVAPHLLRNVISVLTSGRCSEEGLEEATTLLTNLSKCSIPTREQILFMLLDGVRTIGQTLCAQVVALDDSVNIKIQEQLLEKEMVVSYSSSGSNNGGDDQEVVKGKRKAVTTPPTTAGGAAGNSAVGGTAGVVLPLVTPEEQHMDHSHDLHIPAMEPLTCKGSQQSFFVRMLKVVCQLRESAQLAINKGASTTNAAASSSSIAGPSASSNVIASPGGNLSTPPPPPPPAPTTTTTTTGDLQDRTGGGDLQVSQDVDMQTSSSKSQEEDAAAEAAASTKQGNAEAANTTTPELKSVFLQTLSQQLELDSLWNVLSNCLDALSRTEDPHAVFVLQPTVEAFFLVHANYKDEGQGDKRNKQFHSRTRSHRLSSSNVLSEGGGGGGESTPVSPAPFSPLPGTPGVGEFDIDPFSHLPPDTAKFLRFAGIFCDVFWILPTSKL